MKTERAFWAKSPSIRDTSHKQHKIQLCVLSTTKIPYRDNSFSCFGAIPCAVSPTLFWTKMSVFMHTCI